MKSIAVEIEEMRQMTTAELAVRYEALWVHGIRGPAL